MAKKGNNTSFKKGEGGRPAGVQNKFTRTVKETVLKVFNDLQDDPDVKLESWAKSEPTEFYKIAAKLIPTEVAGNIDSKITLHIVRGKPTA